MKRALLIAGGTVGGLGAVLSITPPQLSSTGTTDLSGIASGLSPNAGTAANTTTTQATTVAIPQTATPVATPPVATPASSAPKATTKKITSGKVASTTVTTNNNSSVAATASTPTHMPTPTKTMAPISKGVSGTFAGTTVDVSYGFVQVQITVVDGKITDAQALQAPSGRNDRYTQYAVPILREQTLIAQSSKIQGASGASYTSWGWYTSLQSALVKAGL